MNYVTKYAALLLLALPSLLTSCATSPASKAAKFREENAASFVIRYNSDNTIFRIKPDGHEGPFQRIFTRKEIVGFDSKRKGDRNLAVVIIGFNRVEEVERQIKQSWTQTLAKMNYRRVVFLRFGEEETIDGLTIIEDRQLPVVTVADAHVDISLEQ